jgi:hypothetical protein
LILEPLDRLARPKTHIAGKNIHQFVLRVFCPIGGVLVDLLVADLLVVGPLLVGLQGMGQPQGLSVRYHCELSSSPGH